MSTVLERAAFIREHGTAAQRARMEQIVAEAYRRLHPDDDPLAEDRRDIRAGGPVALAAYLHPDLDAPSELHWYLNRWHLREASRPPGALDAVAAPRGHGKSTIGTEFGALWHVAHCTRRFVVIASSTYSLARERIQAIAELIETRPELLDLYPHLAPAKDAFGMNVGWRETDLTFACGCRIIGVGAGSRVRGIKKGTQRPDLLLLDDLEDRESVATRESISARRVWLQRVALQLGEATKGISALWVGTILSRAALMNLATGAALDPGQDRPAWARVWRAKVYRAEHAGVDPCEVTVTVEEDDGSTWSGTTTVCRPMWDAMPRERLAKVKIADPDAYAAEYLNNPSEGAGKLLARPRPAVWVNPGAPPMERIIRCTDTGDLVPVASLIRTAALDPQFATPGKKKPGAASADDAGSADPDLAAVAVLGYSRVGSRAYLLDGWTGRDRHRQAGVAAGMAAGWRCVVLGVEAQAAQVLVADAAAMAGSVPVAHLVRHRGEDKVTRALGLSVRLGNREDPGTGRVWAVEGEAASLAPSGDGYARGVEALLPALAEFPVGRYDDPVDAVVDALHLATTLPPDMGEGVVHDAVPVWGGQRLT